MSNERLEYIKQYYANQKVKVEVPIQSHMTSKGKVISIFNGKVLGYKFTNGFAMVDKKDLHLFRENFPYMIIHDEEEGEE